MSAIRVILLMGVVLLWAGRAEGQSSPATAASAPASAASAPAARATVTLTTTMEDHKKTLVATVMAGNKPLEGATVAFLVRRTFGNMELGQDKTLDDGTAATDFPTDLAGDPTGQLHIFAEVRAPLQYAGARAAADFAGRPRAPTEPYPRALWAPQAPWTLILVIVGLVAGAWGTYAYVILQLLLLRKGSRR